MPFYKHNILIPSSSIHIWKIEEDDNYFVQNMPWHQKQLDWLETIHPLKKIEYLASRYLIYKITGKLDSHLFKDEAGKLHLEDSNKNLSISHSDEWVGLALSERIIGFDLQKTSINIKKISKRFLNEEEYDIFNSQNDDQLLIIAWTIKEAVYKAHGKKGIHFAEQIILDLSAFDTNNQNISKVNLKLLEHEKKFEIHHGWAENFGWSVALEL
jgi:4'-phosphopantetheinyl transferase